MHKIKIGILAALLVSVFFLGVRCAPPSLTTDQKFAFSEKVDFCISRPTVEFTRRIEARIFIVTNGCVMFHNYNEDGRRLHSHATICGDFEVVKCL